MNWLILFLAGAAVATLGDKGHVHFDVLSYPGGGQPLWVFLEMGSAGVLLAWSWRWIPGSRRDGALAIKETLVPGLWFVVAYGATGPLSEWPLPLALGLLGLFLLRAWLEKLSRPAWRYCLSVALGGVVVESLISSAGLFAYRQPDWGLVPSWLPMLYLHVALATRAVGRSFLRNGGVGRNDGANS